MGRCPQTTDLRTSVGSDTMAFIKAFILSLLGLALSRPNLPLMEDLESSGMVEDSSGLQPRLDMMEEEGSGLEPRLDFMEEEGSGLQPRLDIIEMNGSGFHDEEEGSAEYRMAELLEAESSGDDSEAMVLLVKNFEEELGSGALRSVEIGSGLEDEEMSSDENGPIRSVEVGEEMEAVTEEV